MKPRFLSPLSGLLRAAGRVTGCCCLPVAALLTVLTLAGGCAAPDGSKRERAVFNVADYGAKGDGLTLNTGAIQKAIDAAAKVGGVVVFSPGTYVSGALFLKSGIEFRLDEGVTVQAIQDDAHYPLKLTRVAGIEMVWPSAFINVYQQRDVKITGKGLIDGNGRFWWHKFWGPDGKSGMLAEYRDRGLRWVVDYDCQRVRALAVYDSQDIEIRNVTVKRSGFWSVTLTYCERVLVSGVIIRANIDGHGPSSDGIDIDSSRDIVVEHCDVDCNDDNICLKAGRDADGLRVNRPTENVIIRHCITRSGHGMLALGSETSGGIRNVHAHDITALGTSAGIRIKSARVRGGVIENIRIHDVTMEGVANPLSLEMNWYPAYSYPTPPEGVDPQAMPAHWKVLTQRVEPPERGIPEVRDMVISNVTARGAKRAIHANAYPEKPMHGIHFKNINIEAREAGIIHNAACWTMDNVVLRVVGNPVLDLKNVENIPLPTIRQITAGEFKRHVRIEHEDEDNAVR